MEPYGLRERGLRRARLGARTHCEARPGVRGGARGSASEGAPRAARCYTRLLIRTRHRGIPGLRRKRLRPRSTPIKKGLVASLLATPRPGTFVPKVVGGSQTGSTQAHRSIASFSPGLLVPPRVHSAFSR